MKMRRLSAVMGTTTLAGLTLVGQGIAGGSQAFAKAQSQPTTIQFVQDFPQPAWIAQIPWIVAKNKGYYTHSRLNVNFLWPSTPSDPLKFVATGKADITVSYTPDVLTAEANGLKVLAVASLFDHDNGGVMAWANEVHTPKDFKGKTVALYNLPETQLEFRTMLQHWGLTASDVHIVNAGNYSVPLMVANKVDGADAAAPEEYVDLLHQTKRAVNFFPYNKSNGVPDRYWFVITANPTFAQQHPDAVKAFISATFAGLNYAEKNPAQAQKIYEQETKQPTAVVQDAWKELAKYSFQRFYPSEPQGYMKLSLWNGYEQLYVKNKLLTQPVDPTQFVTNKYLPSSK